MVSLVPWWLDLKLTIYIGQPKAGWLTGKHMWDVYYWEYVRNERQRKAIFINFFKERELK